MPEKNNTEYKNIPDEELISRFQNDDNDAFKEIVMRYKDRIVNFLFRFTGNKESAEDLSQDTFLKLYKNKHRYSEIAKFSTWLYTIALNEAKSNYRKEKKLKTFSINDYYDEGHGDYQLKSEDILPDEEANSGNEAFYIQRAIDSLIKKHREVILLRDVQELDYAEIAKILKVPLGTVRSRLNRARESLKITLENIHKQKKIRY
ncbi:MAG: sigma-70 family RNA polymerase sigma factor [Ignavibacteria bacterium]|nr:sigma-70 family RNA polymerase sigma factor [Ignavibacteria bacterium]